MFGRAIRADDDLFPRFVQAVERVEELFEDLFLALEELDVVEEEDVDRAIPVLELVHPLPADAVDELVEELLRRDVAHDGVRVEFDAVMADGVEEMCLAEAGVRVDEQRVVVVTGLLGDGESGGVGEAVGLADDEVVERVLGNEARIVGSRAGGVDRVDREWGLEVGSGRAR